MRVMPANASGWLWDSLANLTGMLGHLYSPPGRDGRDHNPRPRPWFPYCLDNSAFACWKDQREFDWDKWLFHVEKYKSFGQQPMWAIVPDVVANAHLTMMQWDKWAHAIPWPKAVAVQDGMTPIDVLTLNPLPDVIAVGGTTEWKWKTVEEWAGSFPRVHILRVNSPKKLEYLRELGVESCDGTGWNRNTEDGTLAALEHYCRKHGKPQKYPLWEHALKNPPRGTGQKDLFGEAA